MARFFVSKENISAGRATVAGPELEHMRRVLRLEPGDRVTLFDDAGWEHEGAILSYAGHLGEIAIAKSYQPERESPLRVTLAQALGKGEKVDWVVEKATELGAAAIAPFFCGRTVVRWDRAAAEKKRARWGRIALSAAKQSGRTRVPEIHEITDFAGIVGRQWPCDLKILFWEGERARGLAGMREQVPRVHSLLLVIGPEGGFSPEEAALAVASGFQSAGLGKRILRTETAAVAALSLAQFIWGDLG
ncbi:MAG TPA: 16S rRNA (uracil(1498)-N(3))-methyltransferase [Candidatus Binatia bacterium]